MSAAMLRRIVVFGPADFGKEQNEDYAVAAATCKTSLVGRARCKAPLARRW
jgi:hypothetical protein